MNQWRWSPFLNCELRKTIVQYAPDVVHTHGYKSTALIANKQNDFIHIATIHGTKRKLKHLKILNTFLVPVRNQLRMLNQQRKVFRELGRRKQA